MSKYMTLSDNEKYYQYTFSNQLGPGQLNNQFVLSITDLVNSIYPEDTFEDMCLPSNWSGVNYFSDEFPLNDGTFDHIGKQCACSHVIHHFYYWKYKHNITILLGCDCVCKNIGEELAKLGEKLRSEAKPINEQLIFNNN